MTIKKPGNTALSVSPIGLGLAALGRPGYINLGHGEDLNGQYEVEEMKKRAFKVMDEAYKNGIRYFDVARSYGKGEEFLGEWLRSRNFKSEDLTVGSKWGYTYTAGWKVDVDTHEVKEHSLDVLNRQWEETQTNLGAYLDLYQIHSATFKSGVLENREVLDELWRLKKEEKIHIGLTVSGPIQGKIIEEALRVKSGGELLFDTVQATWNILERSATPALEEAHRQGLAVIIKEALANGRLTAKNQNPRFATKHDKLKELASRYNVGIDALAMAFVMRQPWCDTVLSGAARTDHLFSNIQATKVKETGKLEKELAQLMEDPEDYWKLRDQLEWN